MPARPPMRCTGRLVSSRSCPAQSPAVLPASNPRLAQRLALFFHIGLEDHANHAHLRKSLSLLRTKRFDTAEWPASVTIRTATPADGDALRRLAVLDDRRPILGPALVAEVGGELWAAAGIEHAAVIADPFRPSGELAFVLNDRARRLRRARQTTGTTRPARRRLARQAA
jgi:hypothetical protein